MKFGVADARRRFLRGTAVLVVSMTPLACRLDADREVAERILERYRHATGAKPLPASYVIRMRLSPDGPGAGTGVAEIAWEPNRFRERISSAGMATERGIQSGRAYFTDEDGVTRVASEPVLRELLARSYFWRKAWLFDDHGRARLSLGPADASSVALRVRPSGSNSLVLSFSRQDGRLLAVRSPRFDLDFRDPRSFREASGRLPAVRGEIAWAGLPTGRLPDASVGGGCGVFAPAAALVPFQRTAEGGISFPALVNGASVRLALDATVDAPFVLSAEKAAALSLTFSRDVYGRSIAAGATVEVGGLTCRGAHVREISSAPAGSDGLIGGTLLREAVLELDPKSGSLGFHDPGRWAPPGGFRRMLVDDDGNRPVTTLRKGSADARFAVGSATGASEVRIAPVSAARLAITPGRISGFRWGALALPPVSLAAETGAAAPDWGEDGRLGFSLLLRFHAYLDMPHRWIYLRPVSP